MGENISTIPDHEPDSSRTLISRTFTVIPCIDNGDHRTVGIMAHAASHGLDEVVLCMTPGKARQVAAELIEFANR